MPSKIESDFSNFFSFSLLLSTFLGGVGGGIEWNILEVGSQFTNQGWNLGHRCKSPESQSLAHQGTPSNF